MKIKWARSRYGMWHAFAYFTNVTTHYSVCVSMMKTPPESNFYTQPVVMGNETICVKCKSNVRGMRKRYK